MAEDPTFDSSGTTFDQSGVTFDEWNPWAGASGLAAETVTSNGAIIEWTAAIDPTVTGYRLRLTPSGGMAMYVNAGDYTSFPLTGLASSTTYLVEIAAYNAAGGLSLFQSGTATFTTLASIIGVTTRMSAQYVFGPGVAWATQNTNASGAAIVNPPPILIAAQQDISIDMSAELKELYGSSSFAIAIGRGKQKMGFKIKNAQIHGALWNSMYFGQTLTSGVYTSYFDTTGTVVPASPYTVTPITTYASALQGVSPAFGYDLGVRDVNNLPLQRVVSGPTTRQYSLTGGVYTFAAADAGITYYFSFNYTATSATAKTLVLNNVLMGYAPTFQLDFIIPYQGNVFTATFPNCMQTKLGLATKLDDFAYPEMDINAFAPGTAAIGTLSWSQ